MKLQKKYEHFLKSGFIIRQEVLVKREIELTMGK